MTPRIRAAGIDDAIVVAKVHAECFANKWSEVAFRKLLSDTGVFALLAARASDWESFVLARVAADESEILTLATLPAARRSGLAAILVREAAEEALRRGAQRIFLEVSAANTAARKLYAALGFVEAGVRRSYYSNFAGPNEDALILRSDLPLS